MRARANCNWLGRTDLEGMDQDGRFRMPRPYSADLRERVIMDCEAGVSCTEVARRYRIGERTVYRWVRVAHVEGRRDAKPHSGGRQRVIAGTEDVLRRVVTERNDATLAECFNGRVQREVLGITVASHRDLERLLEGFNSAYNARRQRVLNGRSPEMVVRERLELN